MNRYGLGTLTYNANVSTFDFAGTFFRLIPHGSNEPLTSIHSLDGGRWNPRGTFQAFYAFTAPGTASQYMRAQETLLSFSWDEVQPDQQKDLLVLNWNVPGLADVATPQGLATYQLPNTYPIGFEQQSAWTTTQPIGLRIYNAGMPGLVARSASLRDFSASIINWAEVAVFPDRVDPPILLARIPFSEWFHYES
jgi:hypothetical protein